MRCKKCKKECLESELVNGFCQECISKYKNDNDELNTIDNSISKMLKVCAIVIFVVSVLFSIILLIGNINTIFAITLVIASIPSAILLIALSEIIQLLEDIKNK